MAIKFTEKQQQVIDIRDTNVLVAAAAGSGKTAVLVERIIQRITDEKNPIDIDKILVVTFTNAAAAQMRERIYQAILQKQEENPLDENLIRQASFIHTAKITTIHSFCLFLLQNHFHEIGLDPAFRIGDEGEISLMMEEVLTELLEEAYEEQREDFLYCKSCYAPRVKDKGIGNYILQLYKFAMSYPWPAKWLLQCKREYEVSSVEELMQKEWMKLFWKQVNLYLSEDVELAKEQIKVCEESDGPYMYAEACEKDLALLEGLLALNDYEKAYEAFSNVKFTTLSRKTDETVSAEKKELVKSVRDMIKKDVKKCKEKFFFMSPKRVVEGIGVSRRSVSPLIDLTLEFMERFSQKKQDRNIIDFSDMEHLALGILLRGEDMEPTPTALAYREHFEEIMIDEYQDSNLVQELLLGSISREEDVRPGNRFMVGDVKQSIYKFRLARPEIFLEKYDTYSVGNVNASLQKDEGNGTVRQSEAEESGNISQVDKGVRIDLHQNFRSRKEVIDSVNDICFKIMHANVGGVEYNEEAALHIGADYPEGEAGAYKTELLLYESKPEGEEEAEQKSVSKFNSKEKEAYMIGTRIKEMVGKFLVKDDETGELRTARYGDIVILLRTNKNWDDTFKRVLTEQGIPVYTASRTGYFAADEIQVMMNFLKVINNPYDDIALAGVMTSGIGRLSDAQIAEIRLLDKERSLYENLGLYENDTAKLLCMRIEKFRRYSDYMGIWELLCEIYKECHYPEYVLALPGGEQRKANVDMLLEKAVAYEHSSYHGLYSFIQYMEKLKKYEVDFGEADITEEADDTVKIMSIHKSKGLEFPICFVAGMAKKINLMDTYVPILLDVDLGIGTDTLDGDKRVKIKNLKKNVMSEKMKTDSLGEELRVLYVALTRAKEKLILTAETESYEKLKQKFAKFSGRKVPFTALVSAASQLDYVMMANESDSINVRLFHEEDIFWSELAEKYEKDWLKEQLGKIETSDLTQELIERLHFKYPYEYLKKLYTKTSVSELKKSHMEEDNETKVVFETDKIEIPYLPKFCQEEEKSSGVNRGSAYHRVLELVSYKELFALYETKEKGAYSELDYSVMNEFVKQTFENIRNSGKMQDEMISLVDERKIGRFFMSRAAYRMARADALGKLYREQPFVMAISANRIEAEVPEHEKILIQGIIDVFFYETDEETGKERVVVLDYKTDRVSEADELIRRYRTQLDYYAEALEKLTTLSVNEKIIYSFALAEEITL